MKSPPDVPEESQAVTRYEGTPKAYATVGDWPQTRFNPEETVGKSRSDAMFIDSSSPLNSESPFMGERRLVALLKELMSLNWACLFYKH